MVATTLSRARRLDPVVLVAKFTLTSSRLTHIHSLIHQLLDILLKSKSSQKTRPWRYL